MGGTKARLGKGGCRRYEDPWIKNPIAQPHSIAHGEQADKVESKGGLKEAGVATGMGISTEKEIEVAMGGCRGYLRFWDDGHGRRRSLEGLLNVGH